MEFQNEKSVCFVCGESVVAQRSTKSSCSKLFFEFFSFAQRYLKLNTASWNHDPKCEVFCKSCLVRVKHVCGLYEGLCDMELRLSSTLGELGRLLKQPRENVSVHKDSQKVNINGIRGFVAAKCLEKFKNSGSPKSNSDLEEKSLNRQKEQFLPEENDDLFKLEAGEREVEYIFVEKEEDDDYQNENLSGPEQDPLSIPSPASSIREDRVDEQSSNIAPNAEERENEAADGAFAKTFRSLYHNVCKLRRDSDKESDDSSDNDEKDWKPDSDASWDSKSQSSDDSNDDEQPQKKQRRHDSSDDDEQPHKKQRRQDICEAAKAVTATITSGMKVFPCNECKRPFLNPDDLYFHLLWHEKQLGKQKATTSISCYFCYKSFVLKQTLQVHMQRHITIMTAGNPFKCDDKDCGASFETCQHLDSHLATHSKPIHNCCFCKWGFLDAENLKVHQVFHTPNNKGYQCPSCTLITRNVKRLVTHYYRKHGPGVGIIKNFTCPECGADFANKTYLNKHMKTMNHSYGEEGEPESLKYHFCPHCNARFFYKHLLIKHISEECDKNPEIKVLSCIQTKSRSGKLVKQVPCKVCGKFVSKSGMNSHLQLHLPEEEREQARVICDICGGSFFKTTLKSHVDRVHRGIKKKRVHCQEKDCNKTFSGQEMLNHHVNTVHRGIDVSVVCDVCGKKLASKSNLLAHKKTHAAEKPYRCHLCPIGYQEKGTLRKHLIREHGKAKGEEFTPGEGVVFKFVCMFPSCDAKFVTDTELQSHVGGNHSPAGNNECMCTLCGRLFANQARLTRHNLVHSGEKQHACTVCSKSFAYRTSLKEHLEAVHSIGKEQESFPCDQPNCKRKFKIWMHLRRHFKECHGLTLVKATNLK